MFKFLKGATGDYLFKAVTVGALVLILIFFVVITLSLLSYIDYSKFLSRLASGEVLYAISLSLATATAATILAILVAVPVAYAISTRDFWGKSVVDSLLDLPIVLSPIAIGAALLVFFSTVPGAYINNNIIRFVFSIPGIVLAQFVIVSALAVRLLKSTFDSIDPRYEQVSRTLGCSKPEAFFRIVLPLAKNGLVAAAILTWARAIGEYGASVTLAGATAMKTETLPIAINLSLATADIEQAITLIFFLVIIAVASLIIIRKVTSRRYPL
jgi:molybdate transport system permease protein